ncbi:MAG: aminotransferase class I/II-fold pyridoxal phosphate-dependent enzyme [Porphyromonas sp.]|nr:aminotransferase class I/II-fold pyridoxal phosphate-dependent enzyme [Porphyromonas sp.]
MMHNDHGDDRYLYPGVEVKADFSSNVPHLPDDDGLWAYLSAHRELIHRYPEPRAYTLESELAEMYGVDPASLLITAGATEAIHLIAWHFASAHSVIPQPTFSEYRHGAEAHRHTITEIEIESFIQHPDIIRPDTLVWLCNPNNPTGQTYDHDLLLRLIRSHPDTLFIIDQSYHAFTPKQVLSPDEIVTLPNCIVIQSLTKTYAIPGLRLGYIIASPDYIESLARLKMPWSVNALALQAGHYLLQREVPFDLSTLLAERQRLVRELKQLEMMEIYPTDTHYFTARLYDYPSHFVKDNLMKRYGILIRNASNFPRLTERHIRIATQSRQENDQLIRALSDLPQRL